MKVAVLGASPKRERYSNQAVRLLLENSHEVIPVNPSYEEIEGLPVVPDLGHLEPGSIDTLTVYLAPKVTSTLGEAIEATRPRRVIFNPGTENPALKKRLEDAGIEVVEACTLVLLRTGQFES